MKTRILISSLFVLLTCCAVASAAQPAVKNTAKVTIAPDVASGIYEPGKTVTWTVSVADGATPLAGEVEFRVLQGGLTESSKGTAVLQEGKAIISAARETPGTLLLMVKYKPAGAEKEITGLGGAAFALEKITASTEAPDDFDAFWKAKIAELDAVPMNVKLEPVDIGDKRIEYYRITIDNIRGTKIYGQLAKPAGKTDLPALLQVQWAGVYPLNRGWVTGYAQNGWLAMNISAHNLPMDEKEEFYKEKSAKELGDYPGIGSDDREASYFLRMFLSCRRSVDYLTQRPDWNKKTLVVHGGSQGGYQALVTAGLHPAVTALAANVPAGCDHTGKQVGRSPGWPHWTSRTWQGKDEKKLLATARYFDAMNFASRVKCPALVGVGLIDTTCPAEGVLATCNQLKGKKEIILMPQSDHGGDHKAYSEAFVRFLEKQRKERLARELER